ncbi:MAG: hypothetical protein AAGG50_08870 [Bacteroidota bacterium]
MPDSLIPVSLIAAWLLTCSLVATSLDHLAMRPMEVHVEDYRQAHLSDEQVLSAAVQAAFDQDERWWWIRSGPVHLVFDDARTYDIDAALLASIQHSAPDLLTHLPPAARD